MSDYQLIQFEGCTVAVIAPEDLEAKDNEIERLRRELARVVEIGNYMAREFEREAVETVRLERELAEARDDVALLNEGIADAQEELSKCQQDALKLQDGLAEARGLLREARGPVDHAARYAFGHLHTEVAEDLFSLVNRIDKAIASDQPTAIEWRQDVAREDCPDCTPTEFKACVEDCGKWPDCRCATPPTSTVKSGPTI
jgi:hypothetical protein